MATIRLGAAPQLAWEWPHPLAMPMCWNHSARMGIVFAPFDSQGPKASQLLRTRHQHAPDYMTRCIHVYIYMYSYV